MSRNHVEMYYFTTTLVLVDHLLLRIGRTLRNHVEMYYCKLHAKWELPLGGN